MKYRHTILLVCAGAALMTGLILEDACRLSAQQNNSLVDSRGNPQTLLFIRTTPTGAEVKLNGKKLGTSDMLSPVAAGKHKIVVELDGFKSQEQNVTVSDGRITRIEITLTADGHTAGATASPPTAPARRPRVVSSNPAVGATDVDPDLRYLTVTFDQDMAGGYSFTGGGPDYPTIPSGKGAAWIDRRTCTLPIRLEKGHYYRVGINSKSYQNFRNTAGASAFPSAIYFTTQGASRTLQQRVRIPRLVSIVPENGANDVDSGLSELRVTFDMPMGAGCSWTKSDSSFPEIPSGGAPKWTPDKKTCVLPVKLEPGRTYRFGLNSVSHNNFQSEHGVPLVPIPCEFSTRQP